MSNSKSLAVAQRMLEACAQADASSVTPMQLLKLVYIAHGYMLGKHGRPLLNESVQAWEYGPVVPSVYQAIKSYRSSPVERVPSAPDHPFDADEIAIIELVAKAYGKHSGVVLSAATHKAGTPWQQTWAQWGRSSAISNDIIEAFYNALIKQPKHSAL